MRYDPDTTLLSRYDPPELLINCARCWRSAPVDRHKMMKRFGDVTISELVRAVTVAKACPQALSNDPSTCLARPYDLPVDHWATLEDAILGKWACLLYCRRSMAAMKPTNACPGPIVLDVRALVAALGFSYRLDRLKNKAVCPRCGSSVVELVWDAPAVT